jgi:hypothetical protein
MYTIFFAVQRQQRKSDVMTSFGLTACSAVYYQVHHCRFLILQIVLADMSYAAVNYNSEPPIRHSTFIRDLGKKGSSRNRQFLTQGTISLLLEFTASSFFELQSITFFSLVRTVNARNSKA